MIRHLIGASRLKWIAAAGALVCVFGMGCPLVLPIVTCDPDLGECTVDWNGPGDDAVSGWVDEPPDPTPPPAEIDEPAHPVKDKPELDEDSTDFVPSAPGEGVIGRLASCDIRLVQGETVLFDARLDIDPADTFSADDPKFYRIVDGYTCQDNQALTNAAIYATVQMDTPDQYLCNMSLSIRCAKEAAFWKQANRPLYTLNQEEDVYLEVSNLRFEADGEPRPVLVAHYPNPATLAAAAYMLQYTEYSAAYYDLPDALPYGNTLQVPQSAFLDHKGTGRYWFREDSGWRPSVRWEIMTRPAFTPGRGYRVRTLEGYDDFGNGDVFELGVAAFVWLMQPAQ